MSTALKSGLTTRNKNLDLKRTTKKTTKAKVEIFKDSPKKRREANKKAEKIASEKEKTEEIAENYWELLAEERRVKLEAAIEENKDLCELLETRNAEKMELEELNATLTEENELLREKAMKVNDLESIIAELVSDADDVAQESE
ncbi:unnamed protein product [Oikopleura dioica]|uniref:Geminin n=1 Tax=Oikopleura dioica TaxID=34765 RepID=E4X568_OIKDI|nr:unnamed protein product [Oikopleura dioica]CBY31845.1 unnamed protein product [Oikopleura dioica]CBY34460.1 unnamed protein product [Oikopleura dioica]